MRVIYRIQARADGPACARRIITSEFSSVLTPSRLHEVELMISELVTNAVKYGVKDKNDRITIDLRLAGDLCCTVVDRGSEFPAPHSDPELGEWGLRIVDRLAARWGVTRARGSTRVWFAAERR
jgi:two-component sensor histidine kinase